VEGVIEREESFSFGGDHVQTAIIVHVKNYVVTQVDEVDPRTYGWRDTMVGVRGSAFAIPSKTES
jgi:hypothetical protein